MTSISIRKSESGFSLVPVMISALVVGAIMGTSLTLLQSLNRETQKLAINIELDVYQRYLSRLLSVNNACSCNLKSSMLVDTTDPTLSSQVFHVGDLKSGCSAVAPKVAIEGSNIPGSTLFLQVAQVNLRNITPTGSPHNYAGFFELQIKSAGDQFYVKPIILPVSLMLNSSDPDNAKRIDSCIDSSPPETGSGQLVCVSGNLKVSGGTSVLYSGGLSPAPAFSDIFVTSFSLPTAGDKAGVLDWGIGCQPKWSLSGCGIKNDQDFASIKTATRLDYDVRQGPTGYCQSDDEETTSVVQSEIFAICCRRI